MTPHEHLIEFGIKPSVQRISIMDYLMKCHTHPSVEDVYSALSPEMPTLSKTTVYNTLKLFAESGAITMLTIDEKNVNFDVNPKPHAHFLCKKCGHIYDMMLHDEILESDQPMLEGHLITEKHFYLKGICKNCINND